MRKKNISLRVRNLVRKYNTRNPYEICRKMGIDIAYDDLGNTVKGYYRRVFGGDFIVINLNLSDCLKFWVLLHELGHVVMKHATKNISFMKDNFLNFSDKLEIEAHVFVAEFLLLTEEIEFVPTEEEKKILNRIMELRNKY